MAGIALAAVSARVGPSGLSAGEAEKTSKDTGTSKLCNGFRAHVYGLVGLAVTPDGKLLVSWDDSIKLWRLPDGAFVKTLDDKSMKINNVVISSDGKSMVSRERGAIRLWSLPDGTEILKVKSPNVRSLAITPDWKLLASGDSSGSIRLWSLPDGERFACLVDFAACSEDVKGSTYTVTDATTGQLVTYTLPCGSPIPADATCTCNCVPGSIKPPSSSLSRGGSGGGGYRGGYSCNPHCICMAVRCR